MTTTSPVTGTAGAPVNTSSTQTTQAAAAAADYQSFLKLLTAQLRHQDPLSPLDSTQFVEQLASFSGVEQQIETNKLLKDILDGAKGGGLDSAAQWIGKQVEAETSKVQYSGQPLAFKITPSSVGIASQIIVRDSSGAEIYHENLGGGQTDFTWKGANDSGSPVASAQYSLEVEYELDGEVTDTKAPSAVARVAEARLNDGAVTLVLDNGAVIDPDTVSAIRE